MSNYICTLYAHEASFDLVTNEVKKLFPDAEWDYDRKNEFTNATLILKGGFLRPKKKLKISYRERANFSYELKEVECPVTSNLRGMVKMVENISTKNVDIQSKLLKKIQTINAEFSIIMVENSEKEFKHLVQHLALTLDALVFAQPRTGLTNSLEQAFLDKELNLILDVNGESNVEDLSIDINAKYFSEKEKGKDQPDQLTRKQKSESIIRNLGIDVNETLSTTAEVNKTTVRSGKIIAERVVALALTNLVAFNNITGEQAIQYGTKQEIIDLLTPKEIEFLKNPTEEAKNHETWKCESIWTLFWALGIVEHLELPSKLADLTKIPEAIYPVGSSVKPKDFLEKSYTCRSVEEILEAHDLYYRLDWACLDAKLNGEELKEIHPGVVYERHYTLNWLIKFKDREWDQVTATAAR